MTAILLAPHNDDETLFASFLILRYRPKVIVCLRSERMHRKDYPGGPVNASPSQREWETRMALHALDSSLAFEQWEFSDLLFDEGKEALFDKIENTVSVAEHVIYPAVEPGGNSQHNLISNMVEAVQVKEPPTFQKRTRYLTYTREGRSRDGAEVEFERGWPERKLRALACYGSQIEHPATATHFLDGGLREYVA